MTEVEVLEEHNKIAAEELQLQNKTADELKKYLEKIEGVPASKESLAFAVLSLIPGFKKAAQNIKGSKNVVAGMFELVPVANRVAGAAGGAGKVITQAVQIGGVVNNATQAASNAFSYVKLASAAVDFVRIPAIYIGAAITGQEVPFSWKKNASFVYSAVVVGLTITAIAIPPAAPIIGLVLALGALGQSVLTLANLYHKRDEIKDKLKQVDEDIKNKNAKVVSLIDELKQSEQLLIAAQSIKNPQEIKRLENKIANQKEIIIEQIKVVQKLHDYKTHCQQKLDKLSPTAATDKTMGVVFASLGVIGAVVSLVFPPAGIGILVATASMALTYTVARITYPLMKAFVGKIINAVTKKTPSEEHKEDDKLTKDLSPKDMLDHANIKAMFTDEEVIENAARMANTIQGAPVVDYNDNLEVQPIHTPAKNTLIEKLNTPVSIDIKNASENEGEHPIPN